jgi:DNA invertase Pin-like site-specific DNA recombinase
MQVRAGVYARISEDRDGERLGVERQVRDCVAECEHRGWVVQESYRDNDVSAYGRKARPEYQRMLTDARAGKINAIVCWSVDRLTRHPRELEEIIDLYTSHGISLATVGGEINLGDPDGRMVARLTGAIARGEVEKMSRRIKRKIQERAERGLPHGEEPYGWKRVDGRDMLDPVEAAVVREIADRLLSGESVKAVTDSLNARGITPPYDERRRRKIAENQGKGFDPASVRWSRVTVRHLVLRERNAGLRRHQGQVIGKGEWEPIFDEDTHKRLRALLSDPTRDVSSGSAYRYLLTGIARCGKPDCGAPVRLILGPRSRNGRREKRRAYVCSRCHGISRDQGAVDRLITRLATEFLASPKARTVFQPVPDPTLEAEAQTLRAKLDEAADQYAADEIDGEQLRRITAKLRPRLQEVEAKLHPAMVDLEDLATPDIAERWNDIPLERRRAVIAFLFDIMLLPRGKDAPRRFDPASVDVKPSEALRSRGVAAWRGKGDSQAETVPGEGDVPQARADHPPASAPNHAPTASPASHQPLGVSQPA